MHVVIRRIRAPRRGRSAATALLLAMTLLALPASASAAPFRAILHAPNHTPKANTKWWITVDVTRGTTKLSGTVRYQFVFGGHVVSKQPGHSFTDGLYRDDLVFPPSSVGISLTLQTIVKTKYGTVTLPWAVNTKK
jgi:hypothetical protein